MLLLPPLPAKHPRTAMRRYRTIFRYAGRQRRSFLIIGVLTVAAAALGACQPWPMKIAVDHVLGKLPAPVALAHACEWFGGSPTPLALLAVATLGGLVLFALNSVVEMVLVRRWTEAGRRMVYDLTEDVFARLQRRSLLFHSRHSVGDAASRVTEDSWCIYRLLDALCFAPAQALLATGLMIFLMLQLDVTMTLIALAVAPCVVAASSLIGQPLQAAARLKREIESRIQSHLQQTLTGIPVVQAFAQENRERARFEQFADSAIRVQQYSTWLGSLNSLSAGFVTAFGTAVILWIGAQHVRAGTLSIGGLLVFIVYLTSLQTQMKALANVHTALRPALAGADRVLEVLESAPDLVERTGAIVLPKGQARVRFENVVFCYEPDRPVLRGVTLEAEPGRTTAIMGASGAGKSTLVNLIPRFFDPQAGRVLIDGHDARDLTLASLRQQIAIVLQEPFLFPLSIADNIAYGRPEATRDEIQAAARAANAHGFIENLPQAYDTVIGEHGATLSGGERQRLAIARALLKDAPILILDEPTSALDPVTESLLLEALERLKTGRTTFLIAHRLSTTRLADRLVVLKDGVIVEAGGGH